MLQSSSVALVVLVVGLAAVTSALSDRGPRQTRVGGLERTRPSRRAPIMEGSAQRSVGDGVYSKAQAERGEAIFKARCLACHQPDQFTSAYMSAWNGQPVANLFEAIRSTMPQDDPGGLTRQEYVDTLAFLFRQNGFPTGLKELATAPATLKRVIIE